MLLSIFVEANILKMSERKIFYFLLLYSKCFFFVFQANHQDIHTSNFVHNTSQYNTNNNFAVPTQLPKVSSVARSNSLRSSSPPHIRKPDQWTTNPIPPTVYEEEFENSQTWRNQGYNLQQAAYHRGQQQQPMYYMHRYPGSDPHTPPEIASMHVNTSSFIIFLLLYYKIYYSSLVIHIFQLCDI